MMRTTFLSLVATALASALAAQVSLDTSYPHQDERLRLDNERWRLDELPHPDTTDHLVFETVYSLLQQWPNTRMKNGHTIVPGSIPKGTTFYRGWLDDEVPTRPDWLATDPEHASLFCRDPPISTQGCWQLTFVTTRPLKIVYFDGSSAAKMPTGTLDTQDLIVWGKIDPREHHDDWQRIDALCDWAKKFAVDGIVRMEVDFEVMLCDFSSGVSVVSALNLAGRESLERAGSTFLPFESLNAGSWHNRFPGETRFHLDLAGLVSFYDTQLVPSLVDIRAGQERWDHRVRNTSSEDLSAVKSKLEATLTNPDNPSSGIDWKTLFRVIVDRYAGRLELTRYLLNSSVSEPDEIIDLANKTQSQLRIMLTPYLLLSATPSDRSDKDDISWTMPIYKLCATTHTHAMDSELGGMTNSEKLLLRAVRGTTREICRVVTNMWAGGVYAGIDRWLNTKASLDVVEITHLLGTWREEVERLIGWLDWGVWNKCNPGCGPEEMCYLPGWPLDYPLYGRPDFPPPRPDPDATGSPSPERCSRSDLHALDLQGRFKPDPDARIRPQPRCIRLNDPYD